MLFIGKDRLRLIRQPLVHRRSSGSEAEAMERKRVSVWRAIAVGNRKEYLKESNEIGIRFVQIVRAVRKLEPVGSRETNGGLTNLR